MSVSDTRAERPPDPDLAGALQEAERALRAITEVRLDTKLTSEQACHKARIRMRELALAALAAAAAPNTEVCHICHRPLDQPGALYCSASHGAAAPSGEPPRAVDLYGRAQDTTWPIPGETEWNLRYAPDAVNRLHAASIVSAYSHLVDPSRTQKDAVVALKRARTAMGSSGEPPSEQEQEPGDGHSPSSGGQPLLQSRYPRRDGPETALHE